MSKYFTHILFPVSLVLLAIGFSACEEDDELPSITSEGKNTFGCLVNGELWLPTGRFGNSGAFAEYMAFNDTSGVSIYADNYDEVSSMLISIFDIPTLKEGKIYDLTNTSFFVQYTEATENQGCFYRNVTSGQLELSKYDINQKILAGTFEFKAYSDACNDTVTITEGRFDIGEIMQ